MKHIVKRQPNSRQWGVYRGDELVEGGFFNHDAADRCASEADEQEAREDEESRIAWQSEARLRLMEGGF